MTTVADFTKSPASKTWGAGSSNSFPALKPKASEAQPSSSSDTEAPEAPTPGSEMPPQNIEDHVDIKKPERPRPVRPLPDLSQLFS